MFARRDSRLVSDAELAPYDEANKVVAAAWVAHRGFARPIRVVNAYAGAAAYLRSRGTGARPVVGLDQVADVRVAASACGQAELLSRLKAAGRPRGSPRRARKRGAVRPWASFAYPRLHVENRISRPAG